MFNLFRHELVSRWRMIFIWGIGLSLWGSIYIAIYPDVAEEMAAFADMQIAVAMGMDMTTMEGFIASVVIQILPLILGIYAIMLGTGTLAGEDDKGTLEMVVAMPLERWQVVTMKTLALLTLLLLTVIVFAIGESVALAVVSNITEARDVITLEPQQLFTALLGIYPLMVVIFSISLFLGAIMPNRRIALAVMVTIYLASYVANSAAGLVESLNWLETISIFSYVNTSGNVFTEGVEMADVAVLLAISVVFFLLAVVSFQGRNVTVGQWFWQRGQSPA
ncbi:MAG: ABC transporter permease subunit [Chloroflexota bacterium]